MLDVLAHRIKGLSILISLWLLLASSIANTQDASDSTENLLLEKACKQLGEQYSQYVDQDQAEKVAGLFSESGIFSMNGVDVVGRKAIHDLFVNLQNKKDFTSKHLVSDELIARKSEILAEGTSSVKVYHYPTNDFSEEHYSDEYLVAVANYEDQYILSKNDCLIKHRKVIPLFVRTQQ